MVLETGKPHEWQWNGPDGRNYHILDIPFTDEDGSTLILEMEIDITGYKKAEEELQKAYDVLDARVTERTAELNQELAQRMQAEEAFRETNAYLENLINYANAPIIVWDPDYRIVRFNHAFERLTGYVAEEVIGKSLEILFLIPSGRIDGLDPPHRTRGAVGGGRNCHCPCRRHRTDSTLELGDHFPGGRYHC